MSGASDVGAQTRVGGNSKLLTGLDDAGAVDDGILCLGYTQRLARQTRLIDLKRGHLLIAVRNQAKQTRVGRHNVANTKDNDIAGDQVLDIDFLHLLISDALSLLRQCLPQGFQC